MTETLSTPAEVALPAAKLAAFRAGLRGELIRPIDQSYDNARQVFNGMVDKRPALIVRCAGVSDVLNAVRIARDHDLLVAVRGGGHNVAGSAVCDGGMVVDFSSMKGIRINPAARTARVEPGVTWGELNHDLQAFGLGATGGYVSVTGVPGLTLGGGLGWLMRKHGLACDNLLSADVVTADGDLVRASSTENPDLFWGLRGGGGNFGIVTSFEFQVHPVGVALAGLLVYPLAAAREVLNLFRECSETAPDELTWGALLLTAPRAPFVPEPAQDQPVVALTLAYAGAIDEGERVLRPLREFGPPVLDLVEPMPYSAAQRMADDFFPAGLRHYWKSSFLHGFSDGAIDTLATRFETVPSPQTIVLVEQLGGALARIDAAATAFPHRHWPFNFLVTSMWSDRRDDEKNIAWTRGLWEAMQPFTANAVYVNFLGVEGEERVRAAYGSARYEQLVALKNEYDPTNFFRLNQNIKPAV
jgi:FAD/FMN-containing dehydrogenase